MAQIEIEAFQSLIKVLEKTSTEAIPAASMAAAEVYKQAARAAAPVETSGNPFGKYRNVTPKHPGQLRESVKIIKGKELKKYFASAGEPLRRTFVGPERKKGYYGYFVEHGWKAPRGPREKHYKMTGASARNWQDKGYPGKPILTRRRTRLARYEGGHSQYGIGQWNQIGAREWFEPAIQSADSQAVSAAEAAFNEKLREADR